MVVHVLDSNRPLVRETPDAPETIASRKRAAKEAALREAAAEDADAQDGETESQDEADAPAEGA